MNSSSSKIGYSSSQVLLIAVVVAILVFVATKMMVSSSMISGDSKMAQEKTSSAQLEKNKQLVSQYADAAFNKHDVDKAASYLADNFKQHNPQFPDGVEGFKVGLKYLLTTYPNLKIEGKRIFADGDYVITHASGDLGSGKPGDQKSIMDIFRIENGKIAEHWDVLEDVPAQSQNTNTMF